MGRVVTFGEVMLRLAPFGHYRFTQAGVFEATYGGGEANVAVSLANYGIDADFVTRLPRHGIGQAAVNSLRRCGVGTGHIVRGGGRVGIYFLEHGASQRPSKVIYDRAGSSVATASREDFDWEQIFAGAEWFHFTGITPALGGELPAICEDACRAARRMGLIISCDLNYREKLWTRQEARQTMEKLMPYVQVCVANEEDAKNVFGIEAKNSDVTAGTLNEDGYRQVAEELARRFDLRQVAITLRKSISASDNLWGAMLYDGGQSLFSRTYTVHIVDRVGSGDSFAAALIYSALEGKDKASMLEFATAASCLKHTIAGDLNMVSVEEVESLAAGNASGRVQR